MFLHPFYADDNGLIGASPELTTDLILEAYRWGIFPWFEEQDLFWWFFPTPRLVLFPENIVIHKSMRSSFNQPKFILTADTAFGEVIHNCAHIKRANQESSWITDRYIQVYTELHEMGHAHSFEAWQDGELVGGLYGLSLGKVFYGESMFARVSNASKFTFISLARYLHMHEFRMIDCQQDTEHMRQFGTHTLNDKEFINILRDNIFKEYHVGKWTSDVNSRVEDIMNLKNE